MTFNKVVFDIETTMTADKIWCIVCKHNDTYYQFREDNLHRFEEFIKQTKNELPDNASNLFIKITDEVLKEKVPWPAAQRLWLARMQAISSSFINQEIERRIKGVNVALERKGEMDFQDLNFLCKVKI